MADTRAINFADPINRGHPLNRGRVAWWLTLPGSVGGGTWRDITNNKNTGVLTAMGNSSNGFRTTNRPGGWGHMVFNGVAGRIDLGASQSLDIRPRGTMMAWCQTTSATTQIIFETGSSSANGTALYVGSTGVAHFLFAAVLDNAASPSLGSGWNHIAGTWDGTTRRAFLNGVQWASDTPNVPILSTGSKMIGADPAGGNPFLGNIDDVSIWNRALTPAEIQQNYNLSQRGYPGVLNRLHWPMNFAAVAGGGNHFRRTNQFAKRTGCRQST